MPERTTQGRNAEFMARNNSRGGYQDPGNGNDGWLDDTGYEDQEGYYDEEYYDDSYYDDYDSEEAQPSGRRTSSGRTSSGRSSGRSTSSRSSSNRRTSSRGNGSYQNSGRRPSSSGNRSRKRKSSASGAVIATVALIVIMGAIFGIKLFLDKYSYSKEKADLTQVFTVTDDGTVPITWNNEISDKRALKQGDTYYLDIDTVHDALNERFYYGHINSDDTTGEILYSLPTETESIDIGSSSLTSSSGTEDLGYTAAIVSGDTVYLALPFIQHFTNFDYSVCSDPDRLVITSDYTTSVTTATINRDTQVRTSGGIKSSIMEEVASGDTVTVLEQMDTWSKVATKEGIIGYVENKRLSDLTDAVPTAPTYYTEPEYTTHQLGEKVNCAFHMVMSAAAAENTLSSDMAQTKTVNVIAPTVFWVHDMQGDITDHSSAAYVSAAHDMGLKVWAVVDNINDPDLSDKGDFLEYADTRANCISQIMQSVQNCGYDGVNVDLELVPEENGEDYIQFIRELSIACRNAGLTLSVDNYPAYEFNGYYHLKEQGVFVDYVIIMGYDEHYAGDTEAGSVSSIGYVKEGIQMALDRVDKSKVINAIPFYTRVWMTTNGQLTSENIGMNQIDEVLAKHNMTATWDEDSGQNYAETTEDGTYYQVWIEDNQSIQLKLDAMTAADLAGVAEWKLEFDTADVWDVIANYMNS